MHYGYEKSSNIKFNYGTFIQYAIKEFKNKYDNKRTKTNEIIIKYKIGKEDKIRIFGDEFVKNNIENLKIIYENEELELNAFFDLSNNKKKKNFLEIQLKIIKDITNLSYIMSCD